MTNNDFKNYVCNECYSEDIKKDSVDVFDCTHFCNHCNKITLMLHLDRIEFATPKFVKRILKAYVKKIKKGK